MIKMIAAVDKQKAIGREGKLPWHIPEDLHYFMQKTKRHIVVMGRKTWESLPKKPLPDRINIVVTSDQNYEVPEGVIVLHSVWEVMAYYTDYRNSPEGWRDHYRMITDMYIIGGTKLFEAFLPHASVIYLTEIDVLIEGADAYFPTIEEEWRELSREPGLHQQQSNYKYDFVSYRKSSLPLPLLRGENDVQ